MGETMTIQEVVSTVLTDTLNLVATPEQWTRRAYARDADGCQIEDPAGVQCPVKCYCIDGALRRVVHRDRRDWIAGHAKELATDGEDAYHVRAAVYRYAYTAVCEAFITIFANRDPDRDPVNFHHDLWAWNDNGAQSHADVVTALKLAILREKGGY